MIQSRSKNTFLRRPQRRGKHALSGKISRRSLVWRDASWCVIGAHAALAIHHLCECHITGTQYRVRRYAYASQLQQQLLRRRASLRKHYSATTSDGRTTSPDDRPAGRIQNAVVLSLLVAKQFADFRRSFHSDSVAFRRVAAASEQLRHKLSFVR